jgi:hypothetical protein
MPKEPKMCIFKQASATAREECYMCDGFDLNCENYKLQVLMDSGWFDND